ncbi:cytochrome-c oxidase, cbb3-type subunit I [Pedomonas sp. V897]|uniref:cytochrome-c oxidase, cbb3-type subunit I n=1 Tax=Pedomonas sp. V897 TaxID=3446482 RepID=UPI003EDF6578
MSSAITIPIYLLVALAALVAAAKAVEPAYAVHAFIVMAACFGAIALTIRSMKFASDGTLLRPKTDDGRYQDDVVRAGVIATVFWAVVGFAAGLYVALQMAFPALNIGEYGTFGRLRPVHTSAVIFAFCGNALIATSFYVVQRTCRARLAFGGLAWFVFWGYQLFLILAASGYILGITQSKEYAEPEWYADLWLTVVWVAYIAVYLGTILRRSEPHIYVANWFYLSFMITIAMLHIVNNLAIPAGWSGKSYALFAGVQDALTQWWYGHNAVGFFLTVSFLGMAYYFVPKQAERPVYSYRLSIIHFWALAFMYIWAGPHHLHYTALPDWAQTLGMVFSVMLWVPSWGGMVNLLMTLEGAWDKIRTDPIIRMMVLALAFYGMATFEGPMMSIKTVNSLSHYTDWTVGHVHGGALGWNGMIIFAAVYFLVPRLWGRERLYSIRMVNWHFWAATLGIVLYVSSMWVAGIMQGLMWREYNADGFLVYGFAEVIDAMWIFYLIRALGGVLYLAGGVMMVINVWRTICGDLRNEEPLARMPEYDARKDVPLGPTAAQPRPAPAE